MSRLAKLHKHPLHDVVEKHPFKQRICGKLDGQIPSRVDAINLFIQYRHLYQAMEERLSVLCERDETPVYLTFFNQAPWTGRANKLLDDITEMRINLAVNERAVVHQNDFIAKPVKAFIDVIQKADPVTLYAALTVRGLADVFGGSHLKQYNRCIFEGKQLLNSYFYGAVAGRAPLRSISRLTNQTKLSKEENQLFDEMATATFQMHQDLFELFETTRIDLPSPAFITMDMLTQKDQLSKINTVFQKQNQKEEASWLNKAIIASAIMIFGIAAFYRFILSTTESLDDTYAPPRI